MNVSQLLIATCRSWPSQTRSPVVDDGGGSGCSGCSGRRTCRCSRSPGTARRSSNYTSCHLLLRSGGDLPRAEVARGQTSAKASRRLAGARSGKSVKAVASSVSLHCCDFRKKNLSEVAREVAKILLQMRQSLNYALAFGLLSAVEVQHTGIFLNSA